MVGGAEGRGGRVIGKGRVDDIDVAKEQAVDVSGRRTKPLKQRR